VIIHCGSYRGFKLLKHAIRVVERAVYNGIWQQVKIVDMQLIYVSTRVQECNSCDKAVA